MAEIDTKTGERRPEQGGDERSDTPRDDNELLTAGEGLGSLNEDSNQDPLTRRSGSPPEPEAVRE